MSKPYVAIIMEKGYAIAQVIINKPRVNGVVIEQQEYFTEQDCSLLGGGGMLFAMGQRIPKHQDRLQII